MHLRRHAWNDFFSGSLSPTLGPGEYNSRRTPSASSVYVSDCLFNRITSGSYGGALYCTSATYFLIELSSFFSCKTSGGWGGALHFENSNSGQCVLYSVCGNDCNGSSYAQFSRICVKDDATSKNYVNYSSIARCVNEYSNVNYILYHDYGKICYPSVNISMNKCGSYSGVYCYPHSNSNYVTCSLSYSSFTDITSSVQTCIWFNRDPKCEIKCCNILRNKEAPGSNGLIRLPGNCMIEDCCILENTATYIFYVYSSSTLSLTLSNCTVDKTTSVGSFRIQNTVTKSFIHGLNHMSTQNCHSEYDSAGTLTAIPNVSVKILFCYTCNCQARIGDLLLLQCLFMVTFIYANSS
jgi:hypothetical protein